MTRPHVWGPSSVGHGDQQCRRCLITNREAAALGVMNECNPHTTLEDRILAKTFKQQTTMHPGVGIDLNVFKRYAERQPELFYVYWRRMHSESPEDYPVVMTQEQWWVEYTKWLLIQSGKA